jgi:diguanylate cyclase (GGDEF)-like protein
MIPFHYLQKLTPASFFVIPALATEHGQAIARLCWTPAFAIYLYLNDQWASTPQYAAAWTLTAVHLVFAVAVWQLNRKDVGTVHQRRTPAAVLDQVLIAATLYFTDEIAAPLVLMPLLLNFGSGLRYGRSYAVYVSTLSSILTCSVLMFSPYWTQFPALQVGLAIGTIVLPLYIYRLTDALALGMRTDSMTRLRNRIGFDELLDDVTHCAAKANHASAVVLLDLDGFKQINDVHGHDGGDLVLKHVAYWLSIELSPFGVPARFGGDEFAVIVNKVTDREALEVALTRFLKRTADVGQLFDSPLGASIGVYYIEPATYTTARFAYKAADQLMYRAKKLGKNQLVASTNKHFAENGALIGHPVLAKANDNTASVLTSP